MCGYVQIELGGEREKEIMKSQQRYWYKEILRLEVGRDEAMTGQSIPW